MAFSESRVARMKQLFRIFDINRDGYIDQEDFVTFALRLAKLKAATDPHVTDEVYLRFGAVLQMDTDGDGRVNEAEWMAHCEKEYGGASLDAGALSFLGAMFDLFDVDGDGSIGLLDFVKAHVAANLNPRVNALVDHFNRMDESGNQHIERDEYLKRASLFFLSDDPAVPSLFVEE